MAKTIDPRPIVFLGPSLSLRAARAILDADYRPPVRAGDLDGISAPETVLVIDGELGVSATLRADEVRRAAGRGLTLFGAASTGAMLSAQLPASMRGYGWVYEAFRDGRVRSADEIAVLYRPDTHAALTVPIVSVLRWLERAVETGGLDRDTANRAAASVRALEIADRTIPSIHRRLSRVIGARAFAAALGATGGTLGDVKAEDAAFALRAMHIATD